MIGLPCWGFKASEKKEAVKVVQVTISVIEIGEKLRFFVKKKTFLNEAMKFLRLRFIFQLYAQCALHTQKEQRQGRDVFSRLENDWKVENGYMFEKSRGFSVVFFLMRIRV